ncbi:PEP-CTERM sorting domain-containing protein [Methylibium sp.]|uniref:PEP-CTERM sorting domain-containing protein n=1 Tax=Methylibium sp. TaxID=2067992 RepID=UPI00183D45A2|nr:PEP-CTERM sorting domain-containing protein [Methylibium sp.]MBA3590744.1 PEP-CTERM sorting domain-containing protein [Methylibium sp.]
MNKLFALVLAGMACVPAVQAEPVSILFVGNSYTFGRNDLVMSYNTANVTDLTNAMWQANATGSNVFEPHPWGGVPGIFKQFTVQAGLDYDVALSTRNAASLRGHFLNSNPADWDLRGNIASRQWGKVVLQEQSDEALPKQPGLASNPAYFSAYANKIEQFVHDGAAQSYREREIIGGTSATCQAITGASAGSCNLLRNVPANANASAATDVYLYQTWARPNLVNAPFTTVTDPVTGAVSFTTTPATSFYPTLEAMTADLHDAYFDLAASNPGFAGVAPVGDSFMSAVASGIATRDIYAPDAGSDALIDLWWDDGTHASTAGSYLSALALFGSITGVDPASLGAGELAAFELGISAADALALQRVASAQLGFAAPVPEPSTWALTLLGLVAVGWRMRRRSAGASLTA